MTQMLSLLCCIGEPLRTLSVDNIIEDKNGNVDRFALYNGDPKLTSGQLLPKDMIIEIKEPFYRATAAGGYIIRIGHPSDLVQLRPLHGLVPIQLVPRLLELDEDAVSWKRNGNATYSKKDCVSAVESYT